MWFPGLYCVAISAENQNAYMLTLDSANGQPNIAKVSFSSKKFYKATFAPEYFGGFSGRFLTGWIDGSLKKLGVAGKYNSINLIQVSNSYTSGIYMDNNVTRARFNFTDPFDNFVQNGTFKLWSFNQAQ